ncbi:hypothetical protein WJX73_001802 [Symbiochloris irregularis]|uniref:NmrA-like domain-containing protein n=1 Tax=Symbiochloris irregularis TaxID=706552 RepID=A0AAW1NXV8_9CHLO
MAVKGLAIAVLGASGLQGGAVVDALLKQGQFRVVACSRNSDSDTARTLASKGVEVRQADLTDAQSLTEAFKGCHGVFVVTDTHSAMGDPQEEFLYGKNASDAAKQVGVKHLVFSSLEDPTPGLTPDMPENKPGMQLAVFQVKHQIWEYIRQHGPPATNLITSAYYENYFRWYNFQRLADNTYRLSTNVGSKPFAQNTVEDIGASAAVVFAGGQEYIGRDIPVVSQVIGMEEITQIISEVTGKQVKFEATSDANIRALPFGWASEVATMYQYFRTPHYNGSRPKAAQVVPGVPFREWAERNRDKLLERLSKSYGPDDRYTPFGAEH